MSYSLFIFARQYSLAKGFFSSKDSSNLLSILYENTSAETYQCLYLPLCLLNNTPLLRDTFHLPST